MAKRKAKRFVAQKEVKAIARERVGTVKPGRTILPKSMRKPKYPVRDTDPEDGQ